MIIFNCILCDRDPTFVWQPFGAMTFDDNHLRVLLHGTALLVILRLLAIKEPPLLSSWHDVTSTDLDYIHEDCGLFYFEPSLCH